MKTVIATMSLLALSVVAPSAMAATSLLDIQHQWADCQYNQTKDEDLQIKCLENTIALNQQALKAKPNDPDLLVWLGINEGTLAGVKGGLGALSLVKDAKKQFEKVIEVAPNSLQGSAYTSLGSLYYKVPGWPVGFGDDDKAEEMLKKGLAINPNGIDSNFFYGEFLADQGRKEEALKYLNKAQQAPARPDRPLADKGRKQDIAKVLATLK
ncbi:tetratricopeptide repeat protein [Vibrio rumoiensis]|uniref:Tetratricopeptide repeat protein n=1 Tax=Vibrio rumoiensis TaxID=76258 RepID=A0ABW7IYP6_9VIBR